MSSELGTDATPRPKLEPGHGPMVGRIQHVMEELRARVHTESALFASIPREVDTCFNSFVSLL